MILTVTLNPSVDIAYQLNAFQLDDVNRVSETLKTAGGKGLNVTRVLKELDEKVTATGLIGGSLGQFLCHQLTEKEIKHQFFQIQGETRNCIAILHDEGKQTEILEQGPAVHLDEADGFLNHLRLIIESCDLLVVSGSLPSGLDVNYYARLVCLANAYGKQVVLDCSGKALRTALQAKTKPYVIKPNIEELSQLLGRPLTAEVSDLKAALSQDLFAGVAWVVVSLGAKGALAKHGDKFYQVTIPKIEVINPVGSGDATVAGIASGLRRGYDDVTLLKHANSLGMLNAQEKITGHVNMTNYDDLFNKIQVKEV